MKTMTAGISTLLLACVGLAHAEVGVTVRVGNTRAEPEHHSHYYDRHSHARWERGHWEHGHYYEREPEKVIVVEKKVYVPVPEVQKVEEPKPVEPTWSKETRSMNSAD